MADVDCFLQWGDVKGEATDSKHEKWIEVLSWSMGVTQGSTGGQTHGKASFSNLNLVIASAISTAPFMSICAEGKKEKTAILVQCVAAEGGSVEQVKITMGGAVITSFNIGGSSGNSARTDSMTISYDTIKYEHTPLDKGKKGPTVVMGWDVPKNTKI